MMVIIRNIMIIMINMIILKIMINMIKMTTWFYNGLMNRNKSTLLFVSGKPIHRKSKCKRLV